MANDEIYARITDKILAALDAGTVPWVKPWTAGASAPRSMSSGKPYRGINVLLLGLTAMENGYGVPWWGTYKQVGELGGQVRKGEKSSMAILWKRFTKEDAATGDEKSFMMMRTFNVFNCDQADWADGVPARFAPPAMAEHDVVAEAEALIAGYPNPPAIQIIESDRAFYRPAGDMVVVPTISQFATAEAYYSTMFHELTHSTGAKTRLAREGILAMDGFGSHLYSKEELVAEMGAAMACAIVGIEPCIDQSAAYIKSWLKALQNDPKMVVQAASQAQRAVDHIRGEEVETYE